jgi:glycosyltransferase involved in cell wall biosynthesis
MTAGPLVSVVIPLFNAEDWIEETLRSVFAQRLDPQHLEVLVVNDGSTDHSAERAATVLTASRIQYRLIDGPNLGPSHARNLGWRLARAPWIQFLDADDLLSPDKIPTQLPVAAMAAKSTAVIYSEWQRIAKAGSGAWTPTGRVESPRIAPVDPVGSLLLPGNFIALGSHLIARSWLDRSAGFDEQCWLIEDVHLLLRLAMAGGVFDSVLTGNPLFFYRQRGATSLSRSRQAEFVQGCVRNLVMVEDYWRQSNVLNEKRRALLLALYEGPLHFLAEHDRNSFENLYEHVKELEPSWSPRNRRMRFLSHLVGYRRAESASIAYRRLKRGLASQ